MSRETIKIAKYLSECGIASRRKAENLVKQGLVFVNGKIMNDVAKRIDPERDKVKFGGKTVKPAECVYYLLHKPLGYTSTTADSHAEKLVTALVPKDPAVWPVGRLDKNTTGLIILTNDGNLTQKLTHPKYEIEKEYLITTDKPLNESEIKKISGGLLLEDGFIKPDKFEEIRPGNYGIILHSGKKRIVRRIIEKTGKRVAELKRVRMDFLTLGGLKPGKWRRLAANEVKALTGNCAAKPRPKS